MQYLMLRPEYFFLFMYFRIGRKKTGISFLALAGVLCSIVGGMSELERESHSMRSKLFVLLLFAL